MIPNRYHFVWFGGAFPFTHALAIRSLAMTSAPERITLHGTHELGAEPHFAALMRDLPGLESRRIDIDALLAGAGLGDPRRLRQIWCDLLERGRWAALSDILRYLVLLREGGVYLDLDTITLRDLRPLLGEPGFCGRERLLVDSATYRRGSPWRYLRTGPLDLARWVCSRTESGITAFARIARLFPAAINGAVLALPAGHPLMREALDRLPELVPELERRRPVIGPDLLQRLIDGDDGDAGDGGDAGAGQAERQRSDITIFGPRWFYPLGPQMAAQLFRIRPSAAAVDRALGAAISPDTFVVHWYNDGLRALGGPHARPPDPASIRALADRQLFSRLALPFLPGFSPASHVSPGHSPGDSPA